MSITSKAVGVTVNKSMAMTKLVKEIRGHLANGVYDAQELFDLVYPTSKKHYATVREAIHIAKAGIL